MTYLEQLLEYEGQINRTNLLTEKEKYVSTGFSKPSKPSKPPRRYNQKLTFHASQNPQNPQNLSKAVFCEPITLASLRNRGIELWLEVVRNETGRHLALAYEAPAGIDAHILELELAENAAALLAELSAPREIAATVRAHRKGSFVNPSPAILATLRALNDWTSLSLPVQALGSLVVVCDACPTMGDTDLLDFFMAGLDEQGKWTDPNELAEETAAAARERSAQLISEREIHQVEASQ